MNRAVPRLRKVAERLIDYEAKENDSSDPKIPPAFLVCETLRPRLTTLMGTAGFLALLSRARALANADVPWLAKVHGNLASSLDGLDELEGKIGAKEITQGSVVLIAQLLGLLVAFIGESLAMRLVQEAWPQVRLDDLQLGKGSKK